MAYTTTELVESVKRRAMVPSTQNTFLTADFLTTADEEMRTFVVPFVMSQRQEFFTANKDYTISSSQVEYRIPGRAIGGQLRDVVIVNSAGDETPLPWLEIENNWQGQYGFTLRGNYVALPSNVRNQGGTLRLKHYQRPGQLIVTTSAAQVTAINTMTKVVTCADVPSAFTTSLIYDIIKSDGNYERIAIDQAISARATGASGTVTFSSTLPTELAVGDYIAQAQQSPCIELPAELQPILALRTGIAILKALGDNTGASALEKDLGGMLQLGGGVIAHRVDGKSQKISGGMLSQPSCSWTAG